MTPIFVSQHYINVCRPLVPQYGLSCPGGTSACRAKNSTTTPTSELSLGFPDISMVVVDSRVHLKYLGGSSCPKEPETDLSSVIEFYCDPSAGRVLQIAYKFFKLLIFILYSRREHQFFKKLCRTATIDLNGLQM